MREPKPEHEAAHRPQALERNFEPDNEQQEDDTQFSQEGRRRSLFQFERAQPGPLFGHPAKHVRAHGDANQQKAHDRAQLGFPQRRHQHAGRGQENERLGNHLGRAGPVFFHATFAPLGRRNVGRARRIRNCEKVG